MTDDRTAEELREFIETQELIKADSAEPKSIQYFRNIHTVRLSVLLRAGPTGLRLCPSFRLKRWPPFNI